jgi:predicted MFS family arabinose efflux permease
VGTLPSRDRSTLPAGTVLFIGLFAIGVNTYIVSAILPQLSQDLHESVATAGLLVSAYSLPNAVLASIFGPVSDRLGRKIALVGGMGLFAAAAGLSAAAAGYLPLMVARVAAGLGAAVFTPAAYAYIGDRSTPGERGRAMGTILTAIPLSTVLGLPLGGEAAAIIGWRGAFLFVCVVALMALGFLWMLPADRPRVALEAHYAESFKRVLRNHAVLGTLAITLVWFTAAFGLFTYLGEFFYTTYGLPTDRIALVFTAYGLVGVAATRLGARFIDVIGAKRSVMFGISTFGVAALALAWARVSLPLGVLNLVLWASGIWFGFPAQQTIVSELVPEARGTVMAFNNSALYLGSTVGPAVAGLVYTLGGFPLLGPWSALIALYALILAARILPAENRRGTHEPPRSGSSPPESP